MWFGALAEDLQDIIWGFSGDLRVPLTRYHKFVGLELKCWGLLAGRCVRPSDLRRNYRTVGIHRLKETLQLAYIQAQRKSLLKKVLGCTYFANIRTPHTRR